MERCLRKVAYFLHDIYYSIEDVYLSLTNPTHKIIYDYINNITIPIPNKNKYIIIDYKKKIAFFETYDGNYENLNKFASAICICEDGKDVDITEFMNLFSLKDARLDFTYTALPHWHKIITKFYSTLNGKIERFEFIDMDGNMVFIDKGFILDINEFNIIHKE